MHPLKSTLALVAAAVCFLLPSASGPDNELWAVGPKWLGYAGWLGFLICLLLAVVSAMYMVVSPLRHRDRPTMR
jgi:hypothetical protein